MSALGTNVTIVGGGVAALEALVALRGLAEERVAIDVVSPSAEWIHRPMAVAEPFGQGRINRYDLVRIARDHGAALHLAGVAAVEPEERLLRTWDGRTLSYELLLVAVGARSEVAIPGSITVMGPAYTGNFRTVLRELQEGTVKRVCFALPGATSWPLPIYELALMTAAHIEEHGIEGAHLDLVTPEQKPLEVFGSAASDAITELLAERGITVHPSLLPAEIKDGELVMVPGERLPVERVVSLPRLRGPALPGLPHDHDGYIPVDLHGCVDGLTDVWAAGDATTSPIKQGGVACQQADAAAEAIAARVGAPIEAEPFRPVLRGLLLTGSGPRYLRAEVAGGRGDASEASDTPLWWPPAKIACRWFAPYLSLHHDELDGTEPDGLAIEVEVPAHAASH